MIYSNTCCNSKNSCKDKEKVVVAMKESLMILELDMSQCKPSRAVMRPSILHSQSPMRNRRQETAQLHRGIKLVQVTLLQRNRQQETAQLHHGMKLVQVTLLQCNCRQEATQLQQQEQRATKLVRTIL
jgi:hypothetical protein